MLKAKWSVCLILASGLLLCLPLVSPEPAIAAVDTSSRRNIVLLQRQESPLSNMLLQSLRLDLPRSEFILVPGVSSGDLSGYLLEIQTYFKAHALEAHQDSETMALGEHNLSWGDIKRIAGSGAVLVTDWSYGPIELTGPHQIGTAIAESWVFRVESDLKLNVEVFDLSGAAPVLLTTLQNSWRAKKDIPIRDLLQLQSLVRDVTKVEVDIHNPLHQIMILDVIKKLPSFQQLLQETPSEYLASEGLQSIAASGFGPVLTALKQQSVILPKGGIQEVDMKNMVKIGIAESDPIKPRIDLGYKVVDGQGTEVGYAKVRHFDATTASLQPIMAKRDYVIGDQVVPLPKLGLNIVLRGGTSPLSVDGPYGSNPLTLFMPNTELEAQYDLGPVFGWPELFATLTGGATFLIPTSQTFTPIPQATPIGFNGEIGILKRWFFGPWILDTGASGGILFGYSTNTQPYFEPLTSIGFQGTARVGINYQITPELIMGLHTGFRFASGGQWMSAIPGNYASVQALSGIGPIIQLNASYTF